MSRHTSPRDLSDDEHCLPTDDLLAGMLTGVLSAQGRGALRVVQRAANPSSTTYPTEVVTIEIDGDRRVLFCKHFDGQSYRELGRGHRGGLAYEVDVYRNVLAKAEASLPSFIGAYTDPETGAVSLVLEYIGGAKRVKKIPGLSGMIEAARWIAAFHNEFQDSALFAHPSFLREYDEDYYAGWPRRAKAVSKPHEAAFPLLADLCDAYEAAIPELLRYERTLIHGAYYAKEILYSNEAVYPVDWESAAVAFGEIDIAMLTDRWDADIRVRLLAEYRSLRWPSGAPYDFHRAVDLAGLYVQFRWLGDTHEAFIPERKHWRIEEALQLAQRLGLM